MRVLVLVLVLVCFQQVSGYPTIKYFTGETDAKGDSYSGGRDLESLKKFVEEKLERKCDPSDPTTCSEKEQKFITTMVRLGLVPCTCRVGSLPQWRRRLVCWS